MGDVDSSTVLWGQTLLYTIYALAVISLIGWFAYMVSRPGRERRISTRMFWTYFCCLIVAGVSLHLATYTTIPWVQQDVHGSAGDAKQTFAIVAKDHRFVLPSATPLRITCDEVVRFSVTSEDLTYGFGLFRPDHSMVFQMQVVPGHDNDLMWKFTEGGTFTIRSTEYSGPAGAHMQVADAVRVDCPATT